MIHLLSRLEALFPFIGQRAAGEDDFYSACEAEGIEVVYTNVVTDGLCVLYEGKDYIFLNDKLAGWRLRYVMFHELAHCLFHFPSQSNFGVEFFHVHSKRKNHVEAETVAALLLLTLNDVEEVLASGAYTIADEIADLVSVRLQIYSRYQL